jgi:hypothetical protein
VGGGVDGAELGLRNRRRELAGEARRHQDVVVGDADERRAVSAPSRPSASWPRTASPWRRKPVSENGYGLASPVWITVSTNSGRWANVTGENSQRATVRSHSSTVDFTRTVRHTSMSARM